MSFPAPGSQDCSPVPPSLETSAAEPQPHPQGPDGVQVLGRCNMLLGDALAGRASEGLACNELGREKDGLWSLGVGGTEEKGWLMFTHPGCCTSDTEGVDFGLIPTGGNRSRVTRVSVCLVRACLGVLSLGRTWFLWADFWGHWISGMTWELDPVTLRMKFS